MKSLGKLVGRLGVRKEDKRQSSTSRSRQTSSECILPFKVLNLGSNETRFDIELHPDSRVIEIVGADVTVSCLDFTNTVCNSLGIDPLQHSLMVQDHVQHIWKTVPPTSQLQAVLDTFVKGAVTHNPTLRLSNETYATSVLKPKMCNIRDPVFTLPPKRPAPVSGSELLKQLGTRVIVHLPHQVKLVIRTRLDRPMCEAVAEVCERRHFRPCDYCLCNPKSGSLLDPMQTFYDQQVTDFELKACNPEDSNLRLMFSESETSERWASGQKQYHSIPRTASPHGTHHDSQPPIVYHRHRKKQMAPPVPQLNTSGLSYSDSTLPASFSRRPEGVSEYSSASLPSARRQKYASSLGSPQSLEFVGGPDLSNSPTFRSAYSENHIPGTSDDRLSGHPTCDSSAVSLHEETIRVDSPDHHVAVDDVASQHTDFRTPLSFKPLEPTPEDLHSNGSTRSFSSCAEHHHTRDEELTTPAKVEGALRSGTQKPRPPVAPRPSADQLARHKPVPDSQTTTPTQVKTDNNGRPTLLSSVYHPSAYVPPTI